MEWLASNWHYILISVVVVPMAAEAIARFFDRDTIERWRKYDD
jgi:hypothetical protein